MDAPFSGVMWFGAGVKPKHKKIYLVYLRVEGMPDYRVAYWDDKLGFCPTNVDKTDKMPPDPKPGSPEAEMLADTERFLRRYGVDPNPDVLCTREEFEQGCAYYTALPVPPPVELPDPRHIETVTQGITDGKQEIEQFLSYYWFEPTEEEIEEETLYQQVLEEDSFEAAYDCLSPKMDEEDVRQGEGYNSYDEMLDTAYEAFRKLIGFLDWICSYAGECWTQESSLTEWLEQHTQEEIRARFPEMDAGVQAMVKKWIRPAWFWNGHDTYDSVSTELVKHWDELDDVEKEAVSCWHFDSKRHELNIQLLGDTSFTDFLTEKLSRVEKFFLMSAVPSTVLKNEIRMAALPFAAWYIHKNSIHGET